MSFLSNLVARTNALIATEKGQSVTTQASDGIPDGPADPLSQAANGVPVPQGAQPLGAGPAGALESVRPGSGSGSKFDASLRELFEERAIGNSQLEALLAGIGTISAQELAAELRALTDAIKSASST